MVLAEDAAPDQWPPGPARALVLRLAGGRPLEPLFELRQTRVLRPVRRERRLIAELSLDRVRVFASGAERSFHEVEVELKGGADDDMAALAAALRDRWHLTPQPDSKYARARALLAARRGGLGLGADDVRTLAALAARDDTSGRRARALLAVHHGKTQTQAAAEAGMSERRVRYWATTFRARGLTVFSRRALAAVRAGAVRPAGDLPAAGDTPPADAASVSAPAGAAAAPASPAPAPVLPSPESAPQAPAPATYPAKPAIGVGDTMAAAAAQVLAVQFGHMLAHEQGTRLGEDPEELHDMRVATRRMRAALRVFDGHLDPKVMKPFGKAMRRTGRALGAVRDLDVFLIKTERYRETLPEERRDELEPLLAAWRSEREAARERLLTHLDSESFARFKERFAEALERPDTLARRSRDERAEPAPQRVLHVLPGVLFDHAATVWAFADALAGGDAPLWRYHQLRIAGKGLRYTLEFFEEVLDDEAKTMVKDVKRLQDHLGDLQDAVVSSQVMRTFLTWGTWQAPRGQRRRDPGTVVAPGVAAYLAARQHEMQELVRTFPPVWEAVGGSRFRKSLAALVASLEAR